MIYPEIAPIIVASIREAVIILDSDLKISFANDAAARILGHESAESVQAAGAEGVYQSIRLLEESGASLVLDRAWLYELFQEKARPRDRMLRCILKATGDEKWLSIQLTPVRISESAVPQLICIFRDCTAVQKSQETLRVFEQATHALLASLDPKACLQGMADVIVPGLADWCVVALRAEEESEASLAAIAHSDPTRRRWAQKFNRRQPLVGRGSRVAEKVLDSGVSEYYPSVDEDILAGLARSPEHLEALRGLGICSAMVVPLTGRGRILGALLLASTESRRQFDADDLIVAEELARRAGFAVENALLYQEAEDLAAKLREALKVRDEFLSIASHELKTPLTTLKIQTQIRRKKFLTSNKPVDQAYLRRMVEMDERQVDRLSMLVHDMLDVSRLSSGRLAMRREKFDLRELVEDVLERMASQIAASGCEVTFDGSRTVEGSWDRFRLEQAFVNLLNNALKYGGGTPVFIQVGEEDGRGFVRVSDHGAGIAPEHQERIFLPFERAVSKNDASGLGLGLYIVSQVVEAHGGTVSLKSSPGEGAVFTLRLPIQQLAQQPVQQNVQLPVQQNVRQSVQPAEKLEFPMHCLPLGSDPSLARIQ